MLKSNVEPGEKPELSLDRPADRSLEAFKQFINEMYGALGGSESNDLTEDQWIAAWRKFWAD